MRSAVSVVVERNTLVTGSYATEPYEAGWAIEAIWFIETLDPLEAEWSAHIEISPDGRRWCRLGDNDQALASHGLTALPVRQFGNWMRAVLETRSQGSPPNSARLLVTLVLK